MSKTKILCLALLSSFLLFSLSSCKKKESRAKRMPPSVSSYVYAYTNGMIKRSKIRRIDARQDWVQVTQDSNICKRWKVHTLENESDLLAKIHDPDQFERLRNRCMVFQKIPTEQPYGEDSESIPKCGTDG